MTNGSGPNAPGSIALSTGIPSSLPVPTNDPAFQPPSDPLRNEGELRQRVLVINREIPNVVVQTGWQVDDVRNALLDLVTGIFDRPAQLQDAIAGDSRVQSALKSRSGGLLGRPIRFQIPERYKDDPDAKKCLRAWERHWPQMAAEPALLDLLETSHGLGQSYSQVIWDTQKRVWKPYLQPFNARFVYYHWTARAHIATTLDGQVAITPGDGHWVLHAPYGSYRGWMRGGLRALAQWWLARSYALRDWARYCERHGFPILLADTPFGADPDDIANYQMQLSNIGQESILQLPGSVDVNKYGRYDLRYLEPADQNWQAFKALIEQCNDEITLALLGQNLTSQVKEGSFAAARVHADVRQAILEADARALAKTLYVQVARPFAALNFGDANYAPRIEWNVQPPEDLKTKAQTFMSVAQGMNFMRLAGIRVKDPQKLMRRFGVKLGDVEHVDPIQVEARMAGKTGEVDPNQDTTTDDDSTAEERDDKNNAESRFSSFASRLASVNARSENRAD